MGGGKPATKTTDSTTNKTPYKPAEPYFPGLYEAGANLAYNTLDQYVAGPTDAQLNSVAQLKSLAPTAGSTGNDLIAMAKRIASGEFLDPSQSPVFAGAANAAIAPITQQFTEKVLPGLTNTAIQAGGVGGGPAAFGGASLGVPQMSSVTDWTRATSDATAKMAMDFYRTGASMLPMAGAMSAEGEAQRLMPATIMGQAGQQEQSWAQGLINNILQKYSTGQNALSQFTNMLTAGNYGTQTQHATETQEQAQPSMATQILQGLAGGAGMVSSLFGAPAGGMSAASSLMNMFRGMGGGGAPMLSGPGGWMPAPYA